MSRQSLTLAVSSAGGRLTLGMGKFLSFCSWRKKAACYSGGRMRVVEYVGAHEQGFPRICMMGKAKANGYLEIWFSTGTSSKKTGHFAKNPKASVSYYFGGDSVTLIGNIEIVEDKDVKKNLWRDSWIKHFPKGIDDPEYCMIKFSAKEATIYIDDQFETYSYSFPCGDFEAIASNKVV